MDNQGRETLAELQQRLRWEKRLRRSAQAARPEFSPQLNERILAAIADCEMLPMQSWTARLRQPLALAASLLALIAGGALVASCSAAATDPPSGARVCRRAAW